MCDHNESIKKGSLSMKTVKLLAPLALLALTTGCATTGLNSQIGNALIGDYTESQAVTSNSGASKKGEACATNILGVYASGDASIAAAKRNGNITKVASVDTSTFTVATFYGKVCTIVRGE